MKKQEESLKELEPILQQLENFRLDELHKRKVLHRWMLASLCLLLVGAVLGGLEYGISYLNVIMFMGGGSLFSGFLMASTKNSNLYNEYYKKNIIRVFAKNIHPNVNYSANYSMPHKLIKESKLISNNAEIQDEDYFKGKTANNHVFKFSELFFENNSQINKANSLTSRRVFFVLEIPKLNFDQVLILAKKRSSRSEKALVSDIILYGKGEKIDTKGIHPTFDDNFSVLTKNRIDTDGLLSFDLLEMINQVNQKYNTYMQVSLIKNKVFIDLPIHKDLFETTIHESVLESNLAKELYLDLSMCFGIIENLSSYLDKVVLQEKVKTKIEIKPKEQKQNWNDDAYDHFFGD